MGSSASTRKISSDKKVGGPSSHNKANAGGQQVEGQNKPLTNDGAVVGLDETDGGPAQPNPKGNVDNLVDPAVAKAKRMEELSDEVKKCLTHVKASIKHIQDCEGFPCILCFKNMEDINTISKKSNIDRNAVSDGLGIDTDYCKMFADTWKRENMLQKIGDADQQEELSHETTQMFTFYDALLDSAWRFTNTSDYFCSQMDEEGCLSLIVDWFLHLVNSDKAMNKWVDAIMFQAMNILENACRRVPSLVPKHHRAVPALEQIGKSEQILTQTLAFMTLAKLVKKEEADKLSTNRICIEALITLLEKCLSNPDHRVGVLQPSSKQTLEKGINFSAEELLRAVDDLAINDMNKELIVEFGGIPILAKLLQRDCSVEEKTSAANGIWRLAFLKENKETLRKEKDIIYNLTENSHGKNEQLRNACNGALFEIFESRLPEGPSHRTKGLESAQWGPSGSAKSSGHIMLSYKWEHPSKSVMREFKKQLRSRGYKVWMDEDHMIAPGELSWGIPKVAPAVGDTIGAMAEAVENADIVIACITRGYQDSQDCRSELSYAYKRNKKIIPVKVSDDFEASGWLGIIVLPKMYYIVPKAELVSKELSIIIEKEFAV